MTQRELFDLMDQIMLSLADHPHDSTVEQVARINDIRDVDSVAAAFDVLAQEGLTQRAGEHHALSAAGWRSLRGTA